MIMDAQNLFSESQAVTAAANSTNVIDLKKPGQDIGVGENLYIVVVCKTAMTDSGSDSTLAVALVTDDNDTLSSPTAVQTIGTFPALSQPGAKLMARIAPGLTLERYIGLTFTPANGNLSTGAFTAAIVHGIDAAKAYADNITIS